jgi:hypothetical protein
MTMRRWLLAASAMLLAAASLSQVSAGAAQNAQSPETFHARLSPVPINISMMNNIAGYGSLTATLNGKHLTIEGTFEGLRSPATTAQIRRGPKGIPGPVVANSELTVTKAMRGAISGTLELSPDQIADLRKGQWYVQVQSEGAPDGNSWGWLLR